MQKRKIKKETMVKDSRPARTARQTNLRSRYIVFGEHQPTAQLKAMIKQSRLNIKLIVEDATMKHLFASIIKDGMPATEKTITCGMCGCNGHETEWCTRSKTIYKKLAEDFKASTARFRKFARKSVASKERVDRKAEMTSINF